MGFNTDLAAQSGGVLYVVDEAWKFYSARNWQKTGEATLFYAAQHRHFGDDVLIVTQHTKQIDPAIQRVAQDFWVVTNHSKLSMGFFRQPDIFSVAIYDQAPSGSQLKPMSRKIFKLDKKGLAQTYDTSAGVGLTGRMAADVGSRRKGLPWWGLIVLIAVIGFLLYRGIIGAGWLVGKTVSGAAKPTPHSVAPTPVETKPLPVSFNHENSHVLENYGEDDAPKKQPKFLGGSPEQTNDVVCTGYCIFRNDVTVYLSDGTMAYSDTGEIQRVEKHWVVVFGKRYRIILGHDSLPAPSDGKNNFRPHGDIQNVAQYQPESYVSQSQVADSRPVNDAEILPSIGSQLSGYSSVPRINGFANMSRSPSQVQPN